MLLPRWTRYYTDLQSPFNVYNYLHIGTYKSIPESSHNIHVSIRLLEPPTLAFMIFSFFFRTKSQFLLRLLFLRSLHTDQDVELIVGHGLELAHRPTCRTGFVLLPPRTLQGAVQLYSSHRPRSLPELVSWLVGPVYCPWFPPSACYLDNGKQSTLHIC